MSLKEKLNVVKSEETPKYQVPQDTRLEELKQLMRETTELNGLMKSYIRVHMDKDGTSQMTIDHELSKIRKTSQDVQDKMTSILTKLDSTQRDYANQLLNHMGNGKKEMSANNQQTLQKMSEIEGMLSSSMKEMTNKMNENMNGLESRAMKLISNVKKGAMVSYWLDALKYGLGTAVCVVPLYLVIKFLFSLFGWQMP